MTIIINSSGKTKKDASDRANQLKCQILENHDLLTGSRHPSRLSTAVRSEIFEEHKKYHAILDMQGRLHKIITEEPELRCRYVTTQCFTKKLDIYHDRIYLVLSTIADKHDESARPYKRPDQILSTPKGEWLLSDVLELDASQRGLLTKLYEQPPFQVPVETYNKAMEYLVAAEKSVKAETHPDVTATERESSFQGDDGLAEGAIERGLDTMVKKEVSIEADSIGQVIEDSSDLRGPVDYDLLCSDAYEFATESTEYYEESMMEEMQDLGEFMTLEDYQESMMQEEQKLEDHAALDAYEKHMMSGLKDYDLQSLGEDSAESEGSSAHDSDEESVAGSTDSTLSEIDEELIDNFELGRPFERSARQLEAEELGPRAQRNELKRSRSMSDTVTVYNDEPSRVKRAR